MGVLAELSVRITNGVGSLPNHVMLLQMSCSFILWSEVFEVARTTGVIRFSLLLSGAMDLLESVALPFTVP